MSNKYDSGAIYAAANGLTSKQPESRDEETYYERERRMNLTGMWRPRRLKKTSPDDGKQ